MDDIKKEYTRIKNLTQYKKKNEEYVMEIAKHNVRDRQALEDLGVDSLFTDKDETKKARNLAKKYINNYSIQTVSEKNTLKQLIYFEMLHLRIQDKMNEYKGENNAVPKQQVDSLINISNQIISLKATLGITGDKKSGDAFDALELLKKKYKVWQKDNQGSRTIACPYCGQMVILKRRTEMYESQKHPFFKDRVLTNVHLIKLYEEKKIDINDVALVLETSPDYVKAMLKKAGKIVY